MLLHGAPGEQLYTAQTNKTKITPPVFCFYDILLYNAWMVDAMSYWTLSCGFGFLRPLWTCAGSNRECSQMELAPLLAKVCTIWDTCTHLLGNDLAEIRVCEGLFGYLQ